MVSRLTAPCVPTVYAAASSSFVGPARPTAVLAARATQIDFLLCPNASLPCALVSDAWQCITCDARTNMAEKRISPVHAAARIIFAMPCITYSPIRSATGNVV